MNVAPYPIKEENLPKIKFSKVTSSYKIEYTPNPYKSYVITSKGNVAVSDVREVSKLLVEHMDIIAESRKLINEGKIVTWDKFKKVHGAKNKK